MGLKQAVAIAPFRSLPAPAYLHGCPSSSVKPRHPEGVAQTAKRHDSGALYFVKSRAWMVEPQLPR